MTTNTAASISRNIMIKIKVQSAGYEHGNYAKITLNDQEFGFDSYGRGINVAVVDRTTGQPIFCTTFDTHGDQNAHLAFTNFINSLAPGWIVAIAIQDEASNQLSEVAKKVCESLGSNLISNLQFRNSWAMIGQTGADLGTAQEVLSTDGFVICERAIDAKPNSQKGWEISVTSGNLETENITEIIQDGKPVVIDGGYQRGLNVAIFNQSNGSLIETKSFDLFADADQAEEFAELIEKIPSDVVVAIALKEDAFTHLSERAKNACKSIGSKLIDYLQYRDSYAIIGNKKAAPGTIIENINNSGRVFIKAWISSTPTAKGYWKQQQKLQPSDLHRGDCFGSAVAIDGEKVIVGARLADRGNGHNSGSIYTFQLQHGQWQQTQNLSPGDLQRQDVFGNSVAISSNIAIVGAHFASAEGRPGAGCVYIFQWENGQWQQTHKLQPPDLEAGDHFGCSVGISGEVAIVGAYGAKGENSIEESENSGRAYIFQRENGEWQQKLQLQPTDLQQGDCFGHAVCIDGNIAIVGAYGGDAQQKLDIGSAYIYQLNNGQWQQQEKLQPNDLQAGDSFGISVGISANIAIVGTYFADSENSKYAGSAYIFQLENRQWQQKQKLQPSDLGNRNYFGYSVAISDRVAIVGAYGVNAQGVSYTGSAYIFHFENGQWQQSQKLLPSDLRSRDCFGCSVAFSGNLAIVGAYNADAQASQDVGSVYIFRNDF